MYDEGCLGSGSFGEIWRGGFKRYRDRRGLVRMRGVWCVMRGVIVPEDTG